MPSILLVNKPFNMLSQFRDAEGRATLADIIPCKDYPKHYPAGRLDYDSEGLIILTDNGAMQHRISHPKAKLPKVYWVQVEGIPEDQDLERLQKGIELKDGKTLPAKVKRLSEPMIWQRHPPIRQRQHIPCSWLELTIREGKNRQVRRMTAAIGHPTLRLVRFAVGSWTLKDLMPGTFREENVHL